MLKNRYFGSVTKGPRWSGVTCKRHRSAVPHIQCSRDQHGPARSAGGLQDAPKALFPWGTPCARSSSPRAGIPRLWGFQECCGQPLLLCVHPWRCCNSAAKFSSWGLPGRGPHQTPPIPAHCRTKHWCSLPLTSISRPKLHKMLKRSKTLLGPVVLGFAPRSFQAGSFAPNPSVSRDVPGPLHACPPGTRTGGAGRGWPRSWDTG